MGSEDFQVGERVSGRVALLSVTEHCVSISTCIPYVFLYSYLAVYCFGHNILIIVSQLLNSVALYNKMLKRSEVILWDL